MLHDWAVIAAAVFAVAAAFGGRADVMALLAPQGPVYQAGTLSGNPVASAAGRMPEARLTIFGEGPRRGQLGTAEEIPARRSRQVDVAQHVELPEPLIDLGQ